MPSVSCSLEGAECFGVGVAHPSCWGQELPSKLGPRTADSLASAWLPAGTGVQVRSLKCHLDLLRAGNCATGSPREGAERRSFKKIGRS